MKRRIDQSRLPAWRKVQEKGRRVPVSGKTIHGTPTACIARQNVKRDQTYSENKAKFWSAVGEFVTNSRKFNSLKLIGAGKEGEVRRLVLATPIKDTGGQKRHEIALKHWANLKRGGAKNQLEALESLRLLLDFLGRTGKLQVVGEKNNRPIVAIDGIIIHVLYPLFYHGDYYLAMPLVQGRPLTTLRTELHPAAVKAETASKKLAALLVNAGKKRRVSAIAAGTSRVVVPDLVYSNIMVSTRGQNPHSITITDQFLARPSERILQGQLRHLRKRWESGRRK